MLDRVTITGADNSVKPRDLIALSQKFPFVEWGILYSARQAGSPRFPSLEWIAELQSVAADARLNLSLHLCGRVVRQLLLGDDEIPGALLAHFARVQLNFHGERTSHQEDSFVRCLKVMGDRELIFQLDGQMGAHYLGYALAAGFNAVPLYDTSGGAGMVPATWPMADFMDRGGEQLLYHGYAGGLGPETLWRELPAISVAARKARYWVDMETRVRSLDDKRLELRKVERCLEMAEDFMAVPAGTFSLNHQADTTNVQGDDGFTAGAIFGESIANTEGDSITKVDPPFDGLGGKSGGAGATGSWPDSVVESDAHRAEEARKNADATLGMENVAIGAQVVMDEAEQSRAAAIDEATTQPSGGDAPASDSAPSSSDSSTGGDSTSST